MAVLTSTGITFSDATSQTSAYIGGRGQVFTATGNFTVPTSVTAAKVTVVGGGGSGALVTGPSGTVGGGGGGGGVAIKFVTGLTPGGTVTVTVGAASGTSSFGAFCSATGGVTPATVTTGSGPGGAGGAGSGGDINITGGAGAAGTSAAGTGGIGGGSSGMSAIARVGIDSSGCPSTVLGVTSPIPGVGYFGGQGAIGVNGANGLAATGFGNGGGGTQTDNATDRLGGVGSSGIVIVEF